MQRTSIDGAVLFDEVHVHEKKYHNLLMGALVYRIAGIARSAKESGQFIHLHTRRMMQACVYHVLRDKQAPLEYGTEPVPKAEDGERPAA